MIGNHIEPSEYVGIVPEDGARYRMAFDTGGNEALYTLPEAMDHISRQPGIRVVCADAAEFARGVGSTTPTMCQARKTLLQLAREGRLICLATARHAAETARHPRLRLPDEMSAGIPDDPASLARLGRQSVEFVTNPIWAKWLPATAGVANSAGPLGLAVRVRAQVACGMSGSDGLRLDRRVLPDVVKELRTITDNAFRQLIGYPGAAECFKGGKNACPDNRGFRQTRTDSLKRWLGEVTDAVIDRWGVPVPRPDLKDGWPDRQLRNWPVWSLGAEPLTWFRDLQSAEYLQNQLVGVPKSVVRPKYNTLPHLSATQPDLLAYRRLRTSKRVSSVFIPRNGCRFLQVSLVELPVSALAATLSRTQPNGQLARELRPDRRVGDVLTTLLREDAGLSPAQAELLLVLTATGLGIGAVRVLATWFSGINLTLNALRHLDGQLRNLFPELARYTADCVADRMAKSLAVTPDSIRRLIPYDPDAASRGEGFLHQLCTSGLTEHCVNKNRSELIKFIQQRCTVASARLTAYERPPLDLIKLRHAIDWLGSYYSEPVRTSTGRLYAAPGWVPGRAAFLDAAEDAFTESLFAVLEKGHQVSAIGPFELVLEISESCFEQTANEVTTIVRQVTSTALDGLPVRVETEAIVRW